MRGSHLVGFVCIVFVILSLSGCKKENSRGEAIGSITQIKNCFTEDGILHRNSMRSGHKMEYFDYKTKTYYPLCGKPNCLHDSRECTAVYLGDTSCIGRIGDKWYYQKSTETDALMFYCCDLDGKNEKSLGEFSRYCIGTRLFFDHFLVTATEEWFIEKDTGNVSENWKCGIYWFDLETGREELLVPERESRHDVYRVYGCYENLLAYLELTDEDEGKYELRVMDLETKKIAKPLGDRRLHGVASYAMNENYLLCNVWGGDSWEVIEKGEFVGESINTIPKKKNAF